MDSYSEGLLMRLENLLPDLPQYVEAVGPPAPLQEALMYVIEYIRFMGDDIMANPQNLINAEELLQMKLHEGATFASSFGAAFDD